MNAQSSHSLLRQPLILHMVSSSERPYRQDQVPFSAASLYRTKSRHLYIKKSSEITPSALTGDKNPLWNTWTLCQLHLHNGVSARKN
jgi:hypothetical protein